MGQLDFGDPSFDPLAHHPLSVALHDLRARSERLVLGVSGRMASELQFIQVAGRMKTVPQVM